MHYNNNKSRDSSRSRNNNSSRDYYRPRRRSSSSDSDHYERMPHKRRKDRYGYKVSEEISISSSEESDSGVIKFDN